MRTKIITGEEKILTHLWRNKEAAPKDLFLIDQESNSLCLKLKELKIINFMGGFWKIYPKIGRTEIKKLDDVLTIFKKRAKIKKTFDRYETYDRTKEESGSKENWKKVAESILLTLGGKEYKGYLKTLGFTEMPNRKELDIIYKYLIRIHHPDKGGKTAKAAKIIEAYTKLKEIIKK